LIFIITWKKTVTELFESIGWNVGELVQRKQKAYGDSFGRSGECLRQMFPDGIRPEQYDDLLTIARILDKLFRIANNKDAFNEKSVPRHCGIRTAWNEEIR
jgi:hypothetical protein